MRAVLILLVAPAVAHADPPASRYFEGGVLYGAAEPVIGWNVMAAAGAGYRFSGPWWLRGAVGYGPTVDNLGGHGPNRGWNALARAGVEGRWCSSEDGVLCGLAGADVGVQRGAWQPDNDAVAQTVSTALVAIPRIGFDVGSPSVRVRIDLEADAAVVSRKTATTATGMETTSSPSGLVGIELGAGVWLSW